MKKFLTENKLTLLRLLLAVLLIVTGAILASVSFVASLVIYILAYITSFYEIIYGAIKDLIKEKEFGEEALMTVASLAAMIIGEFLEATLIGVLFTIGELIEKTAQDSSRGSISALQAIRPDKARRKGKGGMDDADSIEIGEIIEILPGERIPLDGSVIDGVSSVENSILTGESTPTEVRAGTEVFAGALNLTGVLYVEVTRVAGQSAAQRIIDLSEKSLEKKTKKEKFIRKFAKIYTPIMIGIAGLIAVIPPLFDGYSFTKWILKACSVLAISCPCAFVVSIPLAYFSAIGYASKKGILIKGSVVLEALKEINTVAFDKTGTITKSDLHVTKIEAYGETTKLKLLEYVLIAEKKSLHPIAEAIRNEAERFNITAEDGYNYEEKAGYGVECDCEYGHIKAGSRLFVNAVAGVSAGTVFVSLNGEYVGYVGIGDELKHNSKIAFEQLRELGVTKRIILSGDKKSKVDLVAKTLGAEEAYSHLLPEHKVDAIEDIISCGENVKIAYCGDGINDLPAIARADVGIAMGAVGSDSAIEKSDIIIMDDDIEKIPRAMKIARSARRVVMENIIFSLAAKLAVLILTVFGVTSLLVAVCADVGVLLLTILNSLRAGRSK